MIIAPILLFSSNDFDEVLINKNTKIRKTTKEDFTTLFAVDPKFNDQLATSIIKHNRFDSIWEPFIFGPPHDEIKETQYPYYTLEASNTTDIINLLFSIKVTGPFDVFCPVSIDGKRESGKYAQHFIGQTQSTRFGKFKENRTIDEIKLEIVKIIFDKLTAQKNDKTKYSKIIDAFNTISNHSLSKTIRYLIGVGLLESLFVNNKKDELSLRFRLFGGYFLKSAGIIITQTELKEIYKNRSTLAHGQQAEIDNNKLNRLIELCQFSIRHEIMTDSSQEIERDVLTHLRLS